MTFRGRFMSLVVTILLTIAGSVAVGALPVSAATPRTLQYVALGDSYAAGQGTGSYLNSCLQSDEGYPGLLDARKHLHLRANASCTGATTFDVVETQLSALNKGTRVVTLTVGGNDLSVASIAAACASGPSPACQTAINTALSLLATPPGVLAGRLASVYAAVAAAAPRAVILVTGYPYLFEPPAANDPNAATIVAINNATTALNATIQRTVTAARSAGLNTQYVDVTTAFAGHGIGSPVPYINATGPDAFHPNDAGYAAYAAAVSSALS